VQNFERATVEDAVDILFERACEDSQLQSSLNLQGAVSFESHTNVEEEAGLEAPNRPKARHKSRGKGNRVDDQLATGLFSEIWPEREIINTDGDDSFRHQGGCSLI
jgi:hypothetical protein